jgi:glyoxylase-like metal-dependent hydrolase (beta-lactamase superfamily II)
LDFRLDARWKILDYLHTLTIPTPFPVGPVNCYLSEGNELTLIDTGAKTDVAIAALAEQLRARGFAMRDIRRVIVTHAHSDHFGLAAHIVAESGARVLTHRRNRWGLIDFENEWMRRHEFYRSIFLTSGAPREYADGVIQGLRTMLQYAAAIPADHFVALDEGDTLELGGDVWRVVFAPGHASGLICLYEPRSQTLISSDHILRDITSNPVLEPPARGETERPRALVDYIASMKKTAELDLRLALPAHGEPIYDVRALIDARLAFHRSRLDHIEQQLGCCAATAYELCRILFPQLKSFDIFLGLSEVIGHLDILELEGRVRREQASDVMRYIPVK